MNALIVRTGDEFKKAIKRKEKLIRVNDSELASKIKILMNVPAASFVGASAALGVAIFSLATAHHVVVTAPMTGGASAVIHFGGTGVSSIITYSLLGAATGPVIALGVILGSVSLLTALFNDYKIVESGKSYVVLRRK